MKSSDRPTHRFAARYFHDDAWWSAEVYAYDFEDAEARCKTLNMKLDGLHVATIPCSPAAAPVIRPLASLACWIRNTVTRNRPQG